MKRLFENYGMLKPACCGLFAALLFASGVYVYFVNQTALHIAEREASERESRALSSRVSALEQEYDALAEALTRERAGELGFVELARVSYVSSDAPAVARADTPR